VVTMQPRLLHCGAKLRMQLSSMTVSAQWRIFTFLLNNFLDNEVIWD
jgi:hypothetical protein